MFKKIARCIGIICGAGITFFGLMPWLGLLSDWNTISSSERLQASVLSGILIGLGMFLMVLSSGLLNWIYNEFW